MRISNLWFSLVLALGAVGCGKSEAQKMCFEGDDKHRLSACGELCDKGDAAACKVQTEVAIERCMKKADAESCGWMCRYAKDGKDLFCQEEAKLGKSGGAGKAP